MLEGKKKETEVQNAFLMSALSLVSPTVISVSFVPSWWLFSETLSYNNLDRQGGKTKRK